MEYAKPSARNQVQNGAINGHLPELETRHFNGNLVAGNSLRATRRNGHAHSASAQAQILAEAYAVNRKWLGERYDQDIFNAVHAAHASSQFDGDPVWLLVIGGSGLGKTETLIVLEGSGAHIISTVHSEGALLSATTGEGKKQKTATGGILRKIGKRGVLVLKDFTTILSMPDRTSKPMILAAFREIYDGKWTRNVGVDGGQELEWVGHLTIIGGCTTAYDTNHSTIAAMGDRFILIRGDSSDINDRLSAGKQAMENSGEEARMRAELKEASRQVLKAASTELVPIPPEDQERILAISNIVTMARSAVDFDYRGKVTYVHDPESPTRLTKELIQLMRGAIAIGLDHEAALALTLRVARDSMPPIRLACLLDLADHPESRVQHVSQRIQKPWSAVDRALQALHGLGLLLCASLEETDSKGKTRISWYYTLRKNVDIDMLRS